MPTALSRVYYVLGGEYTEVQPLIIRYRDVIGRTKIRHSRRCEANSARVEPVEQGAQIHVWTVLDRNPLIDTQNLDPAIRFN